MPMKAGTLLRLASVKHHFEDGRTSTYKPPRGKVMVAVLLALEEKELDESDQVSPLEYFRRIGLRPAVQTLSGWRVGNNSEAMREEDLPTLDVRVINQTPGITNSERMEQQNARSQAVNLINMFYVRFNASCLEIWFQPDEHPPVKVQLYCDIASRCIVAENDNQEIVAVMRNPFAVDSRLEFVDTRLRPIRTASNATMSFLRHLDRITLDTLADLSQADHHQCRIVRNDREEIELLYRPSEGGPLRLV